MKRHIERHRGGSRSTSIAGCTFPASWNARSTLINPLVVFAASILLISLKHQERGVPYLTPFVFLAVNSVACFSFWALRLTRCRSESWHPYVLAVGNASQFIGWLGLLALLALVPVALLGRTMEGSKISLDADPKFGILWGWAVLEAVHHHTYKLMFGFRDTLQYVVEGSNWNQLGRPLRRAVGIQLRKLRRRPSRGGHGRNHGGA